MVTQTASGSGHRMHSFESTPIEAFVFGMLIVLCWITAAYGTLLVPGAFVRMFTTQPVRSAAALYECPFWALSIGAVGGALFALGHFLFHRRHQ